jgi:mono/diheme cytochrome c family protein
MSAEASTRTVRQRPGRRLRPRATLVLWGLLAWLAPGPGAGAAPAGKVLSGDELPPATAPTGPSVLARMGLSLDRTSLGRMAMHGTEPPRAARSHAGPADGGHWLRHGFVLDGWDLYRFNCRSCHAQGGQGLPPEIRPLTVRVRETSAAAVEADRHVGAAAARQIADRARLELLHRIEEGGTLMPAFTHLTDQEIEVLRGYLETLSGVPETPRQGLAIEEPPDRVGEHVVKGTCQICHDAKPGVTQRAIYDRQIPPLSEIPERYSVREFLRKARSGATVAHGSRGRMPQLGFLSDEELRAAYFYLTEHAQP